MNKIIDFKSLRNSSLPESKRFLTVHQTRWNCLISLDMVDPFDFVKLQLGLNHLDPSTRREFEQKYSSQVIPTFVNLIEFITNLSRKEELIAAEHPRESRPKPATHPASKKSSEVHEVYVVSCKGTVSHTVKPSPSQPQIAAKEVSRDAEPQPSHGGPNPGSCWDCNGPNVFSQCEAPRTRPFCFRWGRKGVSVLSCPDCSPKNEHGSWP